MGSNSLQPNLSFIYQRKGFTICPIPRTARADLFNDKDGDSILTSSSDPDIAHSWSLLNEIDLISFFNKTKVSFSSFDFCKHEFCFHSHPML